MKISLKAIALLMALTVLLAACASQPTGPLASIHYPLEANTRQRNLLVLLRGFGADHRVFAEAGIIDEIRRRRLPFDVVAPDVHFGYYQDKSFERRLKADIIDPARHQGYDQIWLAGFSMGGLGSLIYLRSYPEDIAGVLLTSPFLGWAAIHREIAWAGGIEAWQATADDPADWERMIWSWIKFQDFTGTPQIWLGYGDSDLLTAAGPPMLAKMLPAERVFTVPGGHSLRTFKTIFLRHLEQLPNAIPEVHNDIALPQPNPT